MARKNIIMLGIGSNAPDARQRVASAISWLSTLVDQFNSTEPYESLPEGDDAGTKSYYNAVANGLWLLDQEQIEMVFKAYEDAQGRDRAPGAEVVIDIDLVSFNGRVLRKDMYHTEYFQRGLELLLH